MKKLTKSSHNKQISGVCGGLAEYFELDPTLVRVGFVLFGLFGAGVLVYIVMTIVIPDSHYS